MKTFLWALLLLGSFSCFSQTNKIAKDTLTWTDGTKYAGTVIKEDKHTGQIQFMTEDSQLHHVSSSSIARLTRANAAPDNQLPPADKRAPSAKAQSGPQDDTPIDWSDPNIPRKILLKHRTGVGLTIVGTTFTIGGLGMIIGGAITNGQTTTTNNGYSTQTNVNIGAVGGVGLLFTIVGLPMMISGAVKLGRSNKMARIALIHLR